jgi:histidine triad (HIT) family protein
VLDPHCPFCQIINGDAEARIILETDDAIAFLPLKPASLGHTLVVPSVHVPDFLELSAPMSAPLFGTASHVGRALSRALRPDGMNLISSAGDAASQSIYHLHIHLVPRWFNDRIGRIWPPSEPSDSEEQDDIAELIKDELRDKSAHSLLQENAKQEE